MYLRKLRLQRAWSQEQLAEMAGLSTRTVQRLEQGHPASLETLKALAAVFGSDVADMAKQLNQALTPATEPLVKETEMHVPSIAAVLSSHHQQGKDSDTLSLEEREAMYAVKKQAGFYRHALKYVVIVALLGAVNAVASPHYWWFMWPALGWGIGLAVHGLSVYGKISLFGAQWQKQQVEKRLGRKL